MNSIRSMLVLLPLCGSLLCALALGQAPPQDDPDELLPPAAKPGECYARVFAPPVYRTETETVLRQEEAERIGIVDAETEWTRQQVLVREASERLEVVPATFRTVEERVLIRPEIKKLVAVPAVYSTVTERVLDQPAHTVWKKGTGPYQRLDNATGEIMCLVEVPATYKTITKRVVASPATIREEVIPARYETVNKQVVATPATVRRIPVPAEYRTVRVQKVVAEPRVEKEPVPAQHQTITRTVKVSEGRMEWQPILCETNTTREIVHALQRNLQGRGYYDGPVDGVIGPATMRGVRAFQKANGLAEGFLTLDTLQALGVSPDR